MAVAAAVVGAVVGVVEARLTCPTPHVSLSDMKIYRLCVRVEEMTRKKLAERARLEVKDESEVIRDALQRHLNENVDSAYDALMRTGGIGIATGSPSDLSTNKKHFEGFGRSELTSTSGHRSTRRSSHS